jgi:hypothetical protein
MLLSDEVKGFLAATSFAVVCVAAELEGRQQPVVLVKASRDGVEALRAAGAGAEVGLLAERTARGPIVCLVFRLEAEGAGQLVGETYFDSADPEDARFFELLESQELLRVAFLDENMEMVSVFELPWSELRRLEAAQTWDRAEEWLEGTESYDFDAARELFQASTRLDALVARALPAST